MSFFPLRIAILLLSLHVNSDGGAIFRRSLNMKPSYFEQFQELKFRDGITLIPVLLHPKSRGQIRLRSKNPFDKPAIIPNYFQKSYCALATWCPEILNVKYPLCRARG